LNITILICTFNGKNKLGDTLSCIARLIRPDTVKNVEVLLVDNASTDGTAAFAQQHWTALNAEIPLNIVVESKPGKAHALTTGYNAANGDLIVLCDDDNWLDKHFLIYAEELFHKYPKIGMAGGCGSTAIFANDEKLEWFDEFQGYYVVGTHHPHSRFLVKNDYSVYGAGSVLRKTVWDKIYNSGFRFQNSACAGRAYSEDVELSMAVVFSGYKLYFDNRLTFVHDLRWGRVTFDNLVKQVTLNAKGNVYLMAYELIYHRLGARFMLIRFLKDYFKQIKKIFSEINLLKKQRMLMGSLQYRLQLAAKKSSFYHAFILIPHILIRFGFYHRWIRNIVLEK
jgi:glycosyltransferase involved in cell wall biosynthesis